MKVTPVNKKFGKYQPGDVFELPPQTAKVFIKVGKLQEVMPGASTYQTRMMTADKPQSWPGASVEMVTTEAPYGYKADGTPRKRPGRAKAAE